MFLSDFFDDKYFNSYISGTNTRFKAQTNTPCNIYDVKDAYVFDLYLPGFSRNDFDINIDNNILSVKGTSDFAKKNYIHQEHVQATKFERSFSLPKNVDIENVDADYTSGVLSISIPKFKERKPQAKKITVKWLGGSCLVCVLHKKCNAHIFII